MTVVSASAAGGATAKAPMGLPAPGGEAGLQARAAGEGAGFASLLRQAGGAEAEAQAPAGAPQGSAARAQPPGAERALDGAHRPATAAAEAEAAPPGPTPPDAAADPLAAPGTDHSDKDAKDALQEDPPAVAAAQDMALMLSQRQQKPDGAQAGNAEPAAGLGVEAVGDAAAGRPAGRASVMSAGTELTSAAAPGVGAEGREGAMAGSPAAPHGARSAAPPVVQTPAEAAAAAGSARWQTRLLGQALADHRPVPEVAVSAHPTPASAHGQAGAAAALLPQSTSNPVLAAQHGVATTPPMAPDAAAVQPPPALVPAEAVLAAGWKRVDEPDADAPATASATVAPPGWPVGGGADLGGTLPVTAPSAASHLGAAWGDASDALLDPISWWAAQQVQGAQITVAGPGDAPVSVQLRLQGQEAQVLFQSDDRQARQLIHQSLPQLEQMLAGQGLSLGSASVGTAPGQGQGAGAQAQGGGSPPPESGAGRSSADPVDLPPAVASVGTRRPGQGALDLFV